MTTTELIEILQAVEKGASGRPREIRIYNSDNELVLSEEQMLKFLSSGDGCAGAELSLQIKGNK